MSLGKKKKKKTSTNPYPFIYLFWHGGCLKVGSSWKKHNQQHIDEADSIQNAVMVLSSV